MNKTYDGLMRELKNGQDIDRIWAKATKTDVESFDNYQHPGPAIAVVENPVRRGNPNNGTKLAISVLDEVQDLIERYDSSAQAWDLLNGKWENLKVKERGALENAGRVFTEYTRNFKDAFQKLTSLRSYLTRLDYSSMNELTNALDQFKEGLDSLDSTGNQAQKALDSAVEPKQSDWTYDTGSGPAAKMLRSFEDVPTADGLYEHRKFLKNGNGFRWNWTSRPTRAPGRATYFLQVIWSQVKSQRFPGLTTSHKPNIPFSSSRRQTPQSYGTIG